MSDESTKAPRALKVKVKTSKRRTASSNRWLQRQLNDPYVIRSKADGYRSRAAYKLIEIDDKHKILAPGNRVVDLGCAPGGWLQVAAARCGSKPEAPRIVGIDYLDLDPIPGTIILKKDFLDEDAPALLAEALGGHRVDVVLSDMAAPATGHKKTDQLKITYLCEIAIDFARKTLRPGGHFLAKVLRGGTESILLAELKRDFSVVAHIKPPASRADSAELYVMGKNFRGRPDAPEAGEGKDEAGHA